MHKGRGLAGRAPRDGPCPPTACPLPGGRDGWAAVSGAFAHCAGEGKWAPGSCRPAMDVLAAGDRTVAAVSWRLLPGPAGARFAVEKQLGAAWHPASRPHRCRGKVFIQQFPREPGTWRECSWSSARQPNWGWGVACRDPHGVEDSGASGPGCGGTPGLPPAWDPAPRSSAWGALTVAWPGTRARDHSRDRPSASACLVPEPLPCCLVSVIWALGDQGCYQRTPLLLGSSGLFLGLSWLPG